MFVEEVRTGQSSVTNSNDNLLRDSFERWRRQTWEYVQERDPDFQDPAGTKGIGKKTRPES